MKEAALEVGLFSSTQLLPGRVAYTAGIKTATT